MYYPVYPMAPRHHGGGGVPGNGVRAGKQASMDFLFDYAGSVENIGVEVANDGSIQLKTVGFYRANRQSDGCPNGFNQEDTIRRIFLATPRRIPVLTPWCCPTAISRTEPEAP